MKFRWINKLNSMPRSRSVKAFGALVMITMAIFGILLPGVMRYSEKLRSDRVLYENLNSDQAADIVNFLKKRNIEFYLSDYGNALYVDGNAAQLRDEYNQHCRRLVDEKKGQPEPVLNDKNPDPVRVDSIRKELEKHLTQSSDKIIWARVGFCFEREIKPESKEYPAASVLIGTEGVPLPEMDIQRIQWVVANSFAGIRPDDVSVIDEAGRALSRNN